MLAHGIEAIRKHLAGLPRMDKVDIPALRKIYDAAERAFDLPQGITVSAVECGGRPGELLQPAGGVQRAMLYLHGGGYVLGSPKSHRHMIAALALAADVEVLVPGILHGLYPGPGHDLHGSRIKNALFVGI